MLKKFLFVILLFASFSTSFAQTDLDSDNNTDYKDALQFFKAKNYGKSLELFKKMAKEEQPFAMYQVGYMYERGLGVSANEKTAFEWYLKAANAGDAAGRRLRRGEVVCALCTWGVD